MESFLDNDYSTVSVWVPPQVQENVRAGPSYNNWSVSKSKDFKTNAKWIECDLGNVASAEAIRVTFFLFFFVGEFFNSIIFILVEKSGPVSWN